MGNGGGMRRGRRGRRTVEVEDRNVSDSPATRQQDQCGAVLFQHVGWLGIVGI